MRRIAEPVETEELCSYGCGNLGKFRNGSGNLMCEQVHTKCPQNKKKNSSGLKEKHEDLRSKNGKGGFFNYADLPQETKDRMNWGKGQTKETHQGRKKQGESFSRNNKVVEGHNGSHRGVALLPELRWKRNYIPYIDSEGKLFRLESIHEWQIANLLDKNDVHWVRPNAFHLKNGKRYEPDFYLTEYDVYLDPKTIWKLTNNKYGLKIRKRQLEQLEKIKECEKEFSIKILVLYGDDKNSFIWDKIKEKIMNYCEGGGSGLHIRLKI